jgi:hypothetical protein
MQQQHVGTRRRAPWLAVGLAVVVGAIAVGAVSPRGSGSHPIPGSPTGGAPMVGEHSGAGARNVDGLNAAIASMQRLRGEHAGLSPAEYETGAALDR